MRTNMGSRYDSVSSIRNIVSFEITLLRVASPITLGYSRIGRRRVGGND